MRPKFRKSARQCRDALARRLVFDLSRSDLKPNKPFSRAKMLRLMQQIYEKKKWMPALQSGVTEADGKR